MLTKISHLESLSNFRLRVRFTDGSAGVHDFTSLVNEPGPMIEPLRDEAYFGRAFLDSGALTWPNGFDVAPEWLRREMELAGELTPAETAIVDAARSGKLLDIIFNASTYRKGSDHFQTECINLHNSQKINLLQLVDRQEFDSISGTQFFTGQHFYCDVIPRLNASAAEMMRCVRSLVRKGGEDLAANQPNAAFQAWCKADLSRAREIVQTANSGDPLAIEHLTFALVAGNYATDAMTFVKGYSDSRQLSAVAALGRMNYSDTGAARDALATLGASLDASSNDVLNANVLMASFDIKQKVREITDDEIVSIVTRATATPGPQVNLASARVLLYHSTDLTDGLIDLLLEPLKSLDTAHKLTIEALDVGLAKLLDTRFAEKAIAFVTSFLPTKAEHLSLKTFDSFGNALVRHLDQQTQRVIVTWLLSGERVLCEGLSDLFASRERRETPINLLIPNLGLSSAQQIFVCRKAIGYFILHPVIPASILVSVLRFSDGDLARPVVDLLVGTLLRNYSGKVVEYLQSISEEDAAYKHIKDALSQNERYLDNLQKDIKELHPSESHLQLARSKYTDEARRIHKEAMAQSVFAGLVSRSVVLHGRRTLMFIDEPTGVRRPMEMELHPHSMEFELPRMEIVDPVGLDLMIRIFRVERMPA